MIDPSNRNKNIWGRFAFILERITQEIEIGQLDRSEIFLKVVLESWLSCNCIVEDPLGQEKACSLFYVKATWNVFEQRAT